MVMLHDFIAAHREQIIARCREKATGRSESPPTRDQNRNGVPVLLEQLVTVLRAGLDPGPEIATTALVHGRDLLRAGFSVAEVVHTYGDVCQSVTELAVELGATISAEHFRLLNKCLDDAIAGAVTEFGREQSRNSANRNAGVEQSDLQTLSNAALIAFEAIRSGQVGVSGSTGALLHRNLTQLVAIAERTFREKLEGKS